MKETGMVRAIDNLGRVVIPREIRKLLDIEDGKDGFEIFMDGDSIVLKKHNRKCVFCKSEDDCITFENQIVCKSCVERLQHITD